MEIFVSAINGLVSFLSLSSHIPVTLRFSTCAREAQTFYSIVQYYIAFPCFWLDTVALHFNVSKLAVLLIAPGATLHVEHYVPETRWDRVNH